ncbi:MAG: formylglycine-generating enzyme family protein [Cyanobacteria bacterium K_Offshore_surface_m2_239]|nr:formylglycine-generating enzyme family protein [Cyanobacteria bacterium K_Offshore_surface_m2_239]
MAQPPDPLRALLQSLLEVHGARLHPRELAEILWLAPDLPSQQPADARVKAPSPASPRQRDGRAHLEPSVPAPAPPPERIGLPAAQGDPLRFTLPGVFPAPPEREAPAPAEAALLPDQVLPTDDDLRAVLPLRLQDARLLADSRPLQSALQPLAVLEPLPLDDHPRRVLDETATVESWARTRRLWPRYTLPREPRLSLLLVVDGGLSMQVWQRLAEELRISLSQSAVFRDVRSLPLNPDDPRWPANLRCALGGAAAEQVVVVLTDCSGNHWWQGGEVQKLLAWLGRRGPVALLQVLPDWMWRRTALGIGSIVAVRNREPLAPNRSYQRFALRRGEPAPPRGDDHLVVPLLTLEPDSLAGWCALVRGRGNRSHTAACLPAVWPRVEITPARAADDETEREWARRRLRFFFQHCSGPGEHLLRVTAAAPVLTLPVMRLLRQAMVPEGGPLAMAELLLSGLLKRLDHNDKSSSSRRQRQREENRIQFVLAPGVGPALRDTLTVPQTAEVVQRVSRLIEHRWDQCPDLPPFQAFLLDPASVAKSTHQSSLAAFATVTAEIIERLPGLEYQRLAHRLRQGAAGKPPDPFPAEAFDFEELVVPSAVLLQLPGEQLDDAFDTALWVEQPLEWCSYPVARLEGGRLVEPLPQSRNQYFLEPLWQPDPNESAEPPSSQAPPLTLLHIPAGRFQMGSPPKEEGRYDDEGPQHEVELLEFFLAQTPITQVQWRAVALWQRQEHEDAELWPETLDPDPVKKLEDGEGFLGDQRPVVNVSWNDAMAFCQRLRLRTGKNYTLPSEAQWEYACRAGTTTPFNFGNESSVILASSVHEINADSSKEPLAHVLSTRDVACFPANAWGLHDMHDNIREWCLDHWQQRYANVPIDGSPYIDRTASKEKSRLLRGGSWSDPAIRWRSAFRDYDRPTIHNSMTGFRILCH